MALSVRAIRFWLSHALAVAASACAVDSPASGEERLAQSEPGPVPVGTLARAPHYEMLVSLAEDCEVDATEQRADVSRVGVEVSIWGRGDLQVVANPYYALMLDAEGYVYEAVVAGCEPRLSAQLLARGESAKGWISFDVPSDKRGLTLTYLPRLTSGEIEELSFQTGR